MRWLIKVPRYGPFVHLRHFDRQLHYIGWAICFEHIKFAGYSLFSKNRFCIALCGIYRSFSSFFFVSLLNIYMNMSVKGLFFEKIHILENKKGARLQRTVYCIYSIYCALHINSVIYYVFISTKSDNDFQIYNLTIIFDNTRCHSAKLKVLEIDRKIVSLTAYIFRSTFWTLRNISF